MTDVAAAPVEPTSEAVTLTPVTTAPMADAVVTVCKSPVGAHVGISYRVDDAGARRHLHLAFHFLLKDDEAPADDALWVAPRLDQVALMDVRASAQLIARRHKDGQVPYAFKRGARLLPATGALELNGSLGLTCATFLEAVFARANVPLLDAATWEDGRSPERRAEDEAAQRLLVTWLRQTPDAAKHTELVEGEGSPLHEDPGGRSSGCLGDDGTPCPVRARGTRGHAILVAVHAPHKPRAPEVA